MTLCTKSNLVKTLIKQTQSNSQLEKNESLSLNAGFNRLVGYPITVLAFRFYTVKSSSKPLPN